MEPGYSFFAHLLGAAYNPATGGPLWGQDDGDPCRGLYPIEIWSPGSVIISKAAIRIPQHTPPGRYELALGYYNWQSGERVLLLGETVNRDRVSLAYIQIGKP